MAGWGSGFGSFMEGYAGGKSIMDARRQREEDQARQQQEDERRRREDENAAAQRQRQEDEQRRQQSQPNGGQQPSPGNVRSMIDQFSGGGSTTGAAPSGFGLDAASSGMTYGGAGGAGLIGSAAGATSGAATAGTGFGLGGSLVNGGIGSATYAAGAGAAGTGAGAGAGAATAGGGAGAGGLAAAGPWAALAALVIGNESAQKKTGNRREGTQYLKDLFGGKVVEQDMNKYADKWDKDGDKGIGSDMKTFGNLATFDFKNAFKEAKKGGAPMALIKKIF